MDQHEREEPWQTGGPAEPVCQDDSSSPGVKSQADFVLRDRPVINEAQGVAGKVTPGDGHPTNGQGGAIQEQKEKQEQSDNKWLGLGQEAKQSCQELSIPDITI